MRIRVGRLWTDFEVAQLEMDPSAVEPLMRTQPGLAPCLQCRETLSREPN